MLNNAPIAAPRLLIVDDDLDIRNLLGRFLTQHGFDVALANGGKELFQHLQRQTFDAIILDLMMPEEDGLSLCKKIRLDSNIPIIMLSAIGEEVDRIVGLEMGADDYLPKPFNPRELLARIKAILRRRQTLPATPQEDIRNTSAIVYSFCGWALHYTTRQLLSPDNTEVSLSAGEFDLLLALVTHPNHVLSRDQLLDLTKNRQAGPFDRSIDIQISRLRRKIDDDSKKPSVIKTVRGGGYIFTCAVKKNEHKK